MQHKYKTKQIQSRETREVSEEGMKEEEIQFLMQYNKNTKEK